MADRRSDKAWHSPNSRIPRAEQRRRAVLEGKRPKATEQEKRDFYRMVFRDGMSNLAAAKRIGIHKTTAQRWLDAVDEEYLARLMDEIPPDPIPFAKLKPNAKRACEDFWFFRTHYMARDTAPWATEAANLLLQRYSSPREEYVVFNAPPGSGKTTLVTLDFVCWVIVRERANGVEPTILLGHRAESRAKLYVERVRTALMFNLRLIRDFGRFRSSSGLHPWSRNELMVEPLDWSRRQEKEPSVSSASQEGATIGGRYKLIIWDDLVDKPNSLTVDQRKKLSDWWDDVAENRLNRGGLLVLSGARVGPEDLFHFCLRQRDVEDDEEEEEDVRSLYEHIRYPVHDESRCTGRHQHIGDSDAWPASCLLDPSLITWRKVRRYKSKDDGKFRLIWQQEDTDPTGALAEAPWFKGGTDSRGRVHQGCFNDDRGFRQKPRESMPVLSAITVDPAASKFWAIEHWLVYSDGLQAIFQGQRRPMAAHELLYRENDGSYSGVLEDMWQASSTAGVAPSHVVFEDRSMQKHFIHYPFVFEWCRARGVVVVPHDTNRVNKADTETGPEMLGPLYRDGMVDLPYKGYEEKMFSDAFMREAVSWPEGSSTDLVMAHWFLAYRLPTLIVAATPAEPNFEHPEIPSWAEVQAPEWAMEALAV